MLSAPSSRALSSPIGAANPPYAVFRFARPALNRLLRFEEARAALAAAELRHRVDELREWFERTEHQFTHAMTDKVLFQLLRTAAKTIPQSALAITKEELLAIAPLADYSAGRLAEALAMLRTLQQLDWDELERQVDSGRFSPRLFGGVHVFVCGWRSDLNQLRKNVIAASNAMRSATRTIAPPASSIRGKLPRFD